MSWEQISLDLNIVMYTVKWVLCEFLVKQIIKTAATLNNKISFRHIIIPFIHSTLLLAICYMKIVKYWENAMMCKLSSFLGSSLLVWNVPVISIHWHYFCDLKWSEVKVAQSYLTLRDPMDYTVYGILQAKILEWVALTFSRESSQPRDWTQVSHIADRFFTSWTTRGWT